MKADLANLFRRGSRRWTVLALLLCGLIVRAPGVLWGVNFPVDGFGLHHPDEFTLWTLAKGMIGSWETPGTLFLYPRGAAAPVAMSAVVVRKATHTAETPPSRTAVILAGRSLSVLYGTMTVLVVLLLAQRLLVQWPAVVAAGIATALGGLHVSQSHFFLADVPSLFWFTLGLYLLRLHLDDGIDADLEHFQWSAFAFGAAFGTKLVIFALPSLACVALLPGPRLRRIVGAAVFFAAGFAFITAFAFAPWEVWRTMHGVTVVGMIHDRLSSALVYAIELPSVFGFPVVLFGIIGMLAYVRRNATLFSESPQRFAPLFIVWLPMAAALYVILFKVDPFPRHLLILLPWMAIFAGAGFAWAQEHLRRLGAPALALPALSIIWLALFVVDGERNYLTEPRNRAASWMATHVPRGTTTYWPNHLLASYPHVNYSNGGAPQIVVMEMLFANDYLSAPMRNTMPTDYHRIFGGQSPARVERVQSLFRGNSGYHEVARFGEGYFMPELTLPIRLVGDRSRNYLTEIVVFQRDSVATTTP